MRLHLSVVFLLLLLDGVAFCFEPYRILGVGKSASTQEIRKQYKRLAKEWHPDKNKAPEAEAKFIEISKAYELLSDPERRRRYDSHGITEENQQPRGGHGGFHRGGFDPFESFFDDFFDGGGGGRGGGGGFRFNFGGGRRREEERPRSFHKHRINSHDYYNRVLPDSSKQPYVIMFHSDWCFMCMRVEPIWTRLVEELEPVGFGIATIHAEHERELTRKVGTRELPHMVLLMDKKIVHYKDPQFSAIKALEFIRSRFPSRLVETIDDSNVDAFLSGYSDNRIRVLLFGHVEITRLRYLTTAFKYRQRAAVGYVKLSDKKARKTAKRFGVSLSAQTDTLLLFHEKHPKDSDHVPVASVSMKDLGINAMSEVIEANLFLQLPRLSSQTVFDALCPAESSRHQKKLCVTLVTQEALEEHERYRQALRDFAQEHIFSFSPERVKFTYVLLEKQSEFVKSLTSGQDKADEVSDPTLRIAILWRKGTNKLKFEWLKGTWNYHPEDEANKSSDELRDTLKRLLSSNEVLLHETIIKELFDEHAQSIFVRIFNRVTDAYENLRDIVYREEAMPALSLIFTVGFIMIGGYILNYFAAIEESNMERKFREQGMRIPELKVHELRAETYNGLVRLLRPGCRTILVLVDRDSKEKLVPKFFKMAWPYRKNKALLFAFLYLERGCRWYEQLLEMMVPDQRAVRVNPKNCVGTVLALNGHRRYLCMYHARHGEASRNTGSFMGFDDDDADEDSVLRHRGHSDEGDRVTIDDDTLLDGLPMWLDRLFEGTTRRYYVDRWPELPELSPAEAAKLNKRKAE